MVDDVEGVYGSENSQRGLMQGRWKEMERDGNMRQVCHDTPVEVLHFILLGVIKYISNDFLTNTIKPKQVNDLPGAWQSFITDALDLPVLNAAYMYKHHKSMIGKDFKIILQCAPFVFYQFMNEPRRELWCALCQLAPYIFQTQISNMETYIKELEILVDQLLIQLMKSNA
ncbi:hypothetical protein PSTG_09735 [Puccinia striiformis f. sp. tritici PST-78]|uniref:Uncharacterized protein n=1 Tax=Puccinia striiformis f. sp. tritici PST-78 TaxID=1165861 RepID=A0A0L0VCI2_9BASI|nr:hypothetical protein PSTG_09735 [Puccinia striiformis f. sp. tritici PST-78]